MDAAQLAQWTSQLGIGDRSMIRCTFQDITSQGQNCCLKNAFLHFCWSKLAIFLCIICNLEAKIRPQNNSASIQYPSFEDARTTLPTSISIAPNFHQLLSWQWLWQDLSRCIMSYEVAWQHCQDSFRASKSLQMTCRLWMEFWSFCSCSVYCWDATSLITLCWGGAMCMWGEFGAAACVSTAMCHWAKDFHPCSERVRSETDRLREILAILKSISL